MVTRRTFQLLSFKAAINAGHRRTLLADVFQTPDRFRAQSFHVYPALKIRIRAGIAGLTASFDNAFSISMAFSRITATGTGGETAVSPRPAGPAPAFRV